MQCCSHFLLNDVHNHDTWVFLRLSNLGIIHVCDSLQQKVPYVGLQLCPIHKYKPNATRRG